MSRAKIVKVININEALKASLIEQLKETQDLTICADTDEKIPDMVITDDKKTVQKFLKEHPACTLLYCALPNEPAPDGIKTTFIKPFRLGALLSRLHELLQDSDCQTSEPVTIGPWRLKPVEKTLVMEGGDPIRLTDKETALLLHLYRANGATVTREELLAKVWAYSESVSTHTLETHIWRLRQKIEEDPGSARLLITQEGGYRLKPDGLVS